jgi:hypothetical protein
VWPDGRILCADCCACGRGGAQAAGAHAAPGHEAGPGHDARAADCGPSENMPGIRPLAGAVASAGRGKGGDSGPHETGPSCAATAPARAAGRSMPPAPMPRRPALAAPQAGAWPCRRPPGPRCPGRASRTAEKQAQNRASRGRCCIGGGVVVGEYWTPRTGADGSPFRPRPRPGRPALAAMPPAWPAPPAPRPAGAGETQVPAALRGKTILRRNVSAQTSSRSGGLYDPS